MLRRSDLIKCFASRFSKFQRRYSVNKLPNFIYNNNYDSNEQLLSCDCVPGTVLSMFQVITIPPNHFIKKALLPSPLFQ